MSDVVNANEIYVDLSNSIRNDVGKLIQHYTGHDPDTPLPEDVKLDDDVVEQLNVVVGIMAIMASGVEVFREALTGTSYEDIREKIIFKHVPELKEILDNV